MEFMEIATWIWLLVSFISLVSRVIQLITALYRWVRSEQLVQVQWEVKILFRLARPISALIKTVRFGLSYWFKKKIKKNKKNKPVIHRIKIAKEEWYWYWELQDKYHKSIIRHYPNFSTSRECLGNAKELLWDPTIIKDNLSGGIHFISIHLQHEITDKRLKTVYKKIFPST